VKNDGFLLRLIVEAEGKNEEKIMRRILLLMISFVLLACDGSSGSSSSSSSTPSTSSVTAFTSWSAATANVPVAMTGGFSSAVDLVGNISQSDSSGSGMFTRDASNNFTLINSTASTGNSALFSTALDDTLVSSFDGATTTSLNKAQTTISIFANPSYYAFNYQAYGAWGSYGNTTGTSFALSDGSASPKSAIPSVGGISFTGGSAGYYVDVNKITYVTNANMTANFSYDKQTMTFITSNTATQGAPTGNTLPIANLDMTGTLTYVIGTNYFTGTVTATNGMTGKINGEFYGPGINEFGGTFALYSASAGTIIGGFGSKR